MKLNQDIKENSQLMNSNKSIKNLLNKRLLIVVIALILTGLGAALTGVLLKAGVYSINSFREHLLNTGLSAFVVLPLLGGLGGLISGTLIQNIAPAASGSGVSQIMAYLRHRPVPMGLKVGLVKLIGSIIAIGSGFPLGPEGPSVQMGGSVAWQMARWLKAPIAFRRVIVAAGGGAGIAAVFNAPIGGFIYAIEELLNSARPLILLLVVITTFWADAWAAVLKAITSGKLPGSFDPNIGWIIHRKYELNLDFLPTNLYYWTAIVLLGLIIGVLAEYYCKFVITMQQQAKHILGNNLTTKMVASGTFLGFVYAIIHSLLHKEFHNLGGLLDEIVSGNSSSSMALIVFIILFISTGIAAASGAPGGLFYPMLTLGAAIGFTCGDFVGNLTGHETDIFVYAGMGSFVAACSHAPITAMFLAFALTKNLLVFKPILIACITSFLVARSFSEQSIYDRQIDIELKKPKQIELELEK